MGIFLTAERLLWYQLTAWISNSLMFLKPLRIYPTILWIELHPSISIEPFDTFYSCYSDVCISQGSPEKQNQLDIYMCIHTHTHICIYTHTHIYTKTGTKRFIIVTLVIMKSNESKICNGGWEAGDPLTVNSTHEIQRSVVWRSRRAESAVPFWRQFAGQFLLTWGQFSCSVWTYNLLDKAHPLYGGQSAY